MQLAFGTEVKTVDGGQRKTAHACLPMGYTLLRLLDDAGPIKIPLPPAHYIPTTRFRRGLYEVIGVCKFTWVRSISVQGIQLNVHESRGGDVVGYDSRHDCLSIAFHVFLDFRSVCLCMVKAFHVSRFRLRFYNRAYDRQMFPPIRSPNFMLSCGVLCACSCCGRLRPVTL